MATSKRWGICVSRAGSLCSDDFLARCKDDGDDEEEEQEEEEEEEEQEQEEEESKERTSPCGVLRSPTVV
jgi:hypothetical protein